jgi:hypothetical protein
MIKTLVLLIAAHAIADFFLQPNSLVRRKEKNAYLLIHAFIHAAVAYVALQAWSCWQAPLYIFQVHALIDAVKRRRNDTAAAYVLIETLLSFSLAIALASATKWAREQPCVNGQVTSAA